MFSSEHHPQLFQVSWSYPTLLGIAYQHHYPACLHLVAVVNPCPSHTVIHSSLPIIIITMKSASALITAPAVAFAIFAGVAAPVVAASEVEVRSGGDDYGHDNYGHDGYGHDDSYGRDDGYGHDDSYGHDDNEYGGHGHHKRSGGDSYGGYDDDSHGYHKRSDATVTKTIIITDPTQWSGLFTSQVTGILPRDSAQAITIWGGDSQTVVLPTQITIDTTQVTWVPAPTAATVQGSSGGSSSQQQQGSHEQSGGQSQGGNQGVNQGQTWHNANTAGFHHGGGGGWGSGAASAKGVAWTGLALAGLGAVVAVL